MFSEKANTSSGLFMRRRCFIISTTGLAPYELQTEAQANQGKLPELDAVSHADARLQSVPEFFASEEAADRLNDKIAKRWLLAFRDITGSEKQRTVIASVLPIVAVGHTAPLIFSERNNAEELALFVCKVFAVSQWTTLRARRWLELPLTYGYLKQLPVLLSRPLR